MLLDETNSSGKPPDSELYDKLRCIKPVRLPREGEMLPSRPLDARNTTVTILFGLQVIPSHAQHSVPFFHDLPKPPSFESPARNWMREFLSCSVQELMGEAKKSSNTRARPKEDIAGLDVTMDDMWLAGIMDIRKSPACSLGNFEPHWPVKKCACIIIPVMKPIVQAPILHAGEVHFAKITTEVVFLESASTAKDGELLQILLGIFPVKPLLLALSATKLFIISHVANGNCPVKKLLEIGRTEVEDGSSCISPLRPLKLTSRTTMLLDTINSSGKPPDNELWDRLSRNRPVRLPRDGEICPSRPLEASETSVTVPSVLQVIPSHVQQSVAFRHETARPPLLERLERNWRREFFSCSVHELVGETRESNSSSAKARLSPTKSMGNPLLFFLHEEWSFCCFCMAT
uniref:Uncharacterized protein n=1 Tax=Leersia perrieri TaxID=77586 RepID=A0A0D9VCC3_9ORYZ